ncbi:uncharacterized protein BX664DRAFT_331531 [Halteromyces radiatus]|uniref:uncharacterized protein n=1 Tax=Halteromyces radiatus TaxID=101107 RepID=UPI00221F653D|nr:uncharacterized protein BX664DRAFT_331531 [Halteromyces radiatus]KAI8088843.1 hypothetical protein BX664DRAFT_331531 [Halteromyces radiatus]
MPSIIVPSEYGYVLATTVATSIYLVFLTSRVGKARGKANVPYPYAYAEKSEAEKDPLKNIFNCTQRAHQNTLEFWPVVTSLSLIGGLAHPQVAAAAHAWWLLGRIVYVRGYVTGNPRNRLYGVAGQLGLLPLLFTAISSVYYLIK